jgi:hypothetical protein
VSAINVLTLSNVALLPQTCCECVRDYADTYVPVPRVPVVSARWSLEINSDGTRRLIESWSVNQDEHNSSET